MKVRLKVARRYTHTVHLHGDAGRDVRWPTLEGRYEESEGERVSRGVEGEVDDEGEESMENLERYHLVACSHLLFE